MVKNIFTFLCAFWMISLQAVEVHDMQDVAIHLQEAGADTLVIFDVDMVLVQPQNPAFQMPNMKRHSAVAKRVIKSVPTEKQPLFLGLMTLRSDPMLIDPQVPALLQALQSRGVPAMAMTANLTGELAGIQDIEYRRAAQLRALGIDFSLTAPHHGRIVFHQLPAYRGYPSLYFDGFFFVNGTACTKGQALVEFLKHTGIHPKKIVFIDDRAENLTSVQEALEGSPIAVDVLHYVGALDYPSTPLSESDFEAQWEALAGDSRGMD